MSSGGKLAASMVKQAISAHDPVAAGSADKRAVIVNDVLKPTASHPLPVPDSAHSRLGGQEVVGLFMPHHTEVPPDDPIASTDINQGKTLTFKLSEHLADVHDYHRQLALELTVSRATVDTTALAPIGWGSFTLKTDNGNVQLGATIDPDSYWVYSLWTTHYTRNARNQAANPLNVQNVAVTATSVTYHIPLPFDLTHLNLCEAKGGIDLEYTFRSGGVNIGAGLLALESASVVATGSLVPAPTRPLANIEFQQTVHEAGVIEMHHHSTTQAVTPGTAAEVEITMDKSPGNVVGVLLYATADGDQIPNFCWLGTQTTVNWVDRTNHPLIPKPVEMSELLYSSAIPSDARTLSDPTTKDTIANSVLWSFGDDASHMASGGMSGVHFIEGSGDTRTKLVVNTSATADESSYGTEATFARGQGAGNYTFHAVALTHRMIRQDGDGSLSLI